MSETQQIQRLLPRHYKMLDLALDGCTRAQIAEKLGVTPQMVGIVMKSPLFQSELVRRREGLDKMKDHARVSETQASVSKAREVLEGSALRAAETHSELLDDGDPLVRQRSANAILDRVYGKAGQGDNSKGQAIQISGEQLQVLMVALREDEG